MATLGLVFDRVTGRCRPTEWTHQTPRAGEHCGQWVRPGDATAHGRGPGVSAPRLSPAIPVGCGGGEAGTEGGRRRGRGRVLYSRPVSALQGPRRLVSHVRTRVSYRDPWQGVHVGGRGEGRPSDQVRVCEGALGRDEETVSERGSERVCPVQGGLAGARAADGAAGDRAVTVRRERRPGTAPPGGVAGLGYGPGHRQAGG